jgi:hypothetical protein
MVTGMALQRLARWMRTTKAQRQAEAALMLALIEAQCNAWVNA